MGIEKLVVFLTVNNGSEVKNPRSVLVIEALRRCGCTTVVLSDLAEYDDVVPEAAENVVPLFDLGTGVNRWSPCSKVVRGVPDWAWGLSSSECIAIGKRCVDFPNRVLHAARQIARMFSREHHENGNGGKPWSHDGPSSRRRRKRRTWRQPLQFGLFWRGGK